MNLYERQYINKQIQNNMQILDLLGSVGAQGRQNFRERTKVNSDI